MDRKSLTRRGCLPGGALALALALLPGPIVSAQAPAAAGSISQMTTATTAPARPKIGLALSGGGARGAAHIGVLRALEEHHIPVDYIAGTSMGAIVGGLYATGMTPDEIERTLTTADWATLFTDKPPRRQLPFRKKQDDRRYLDFEVGVDKKGLHAGLGLIRGQHLNAFLETLLLKAGEQRTFDDLPIPFRCVATDIVTGERVVISQGHLATAIRASMSIPSVFNPVELDDHLLVDGGLVDNLPVDVVKAMGADVVIAVDIGTPPLTREQLTSFVAVSSQMVSILMQKNVQESILKADILIQPDLKGFSNMDFPNAGQLVPVGYEAAQAKAGEYSPYAIGAAEHAEGLARARALLPPPPAALDFVEFEGTDPKSEALVRGKMSTKPGQPFDSTKISDDLDRVQAVGEFETVNYQLVEREGQKGLVIRAKQNPLGPNRMRFGLKLTTDFKNVSNWAVLAGLRVTQLNGLGAEWKSDMEVGLDRQLYTEFYQPLNTSGRWFVAPYGEYSNLRQDLYVQTGAASTYRVSKLDGGADLGLSFSKYGELRLGPVWGHIKYSQVIGSELFEDVGDKRSSFAGVRGLLTMDHLDNADFPEQGYLLVAEGFESVSGMGGDDEFRAFEVRYRSYLDLGKTSLMAGLVGGTALGSDLPSYALFRAGGITNFGGYEEGELLGRYYAVARLGLTHMVGELPTFVGKGVYVYGFADVGNCWLTLGQVDWGDLRYSGTVGVATSTRFGPLHLAYSHTSDGGDLLTLYMGKRF